MSEKGKSVAEVTPTFTGIDPKATTAIDTIIDDYIHIKNALVNDDGKDAANGGKAMAEAMSKVPYYGSKMLTCGKVEEMIK